MDASGNPVPRPSFGAAGFPSWVVVTHLLRRIYLLRLPEWAMDDLPGNARHPCP